MKKFIRFVALAAVLAVTASIVTPAGAVAGNGNGNGNGGGGGGGGNVCQPQDDHEYPVTETEKSVTVTAPDGKVITGYCVKAGSANQDLGPEYVEGLNATEVTFSHSSGKDISHYIVFYGDIEINDWEYADPTCTSLFVDYPDWITPANANDVNIRFVGNGQTFTLNWHTAGTFTPEYTFVYADHPNWPAGLTVFTVEWVQVGETNYHWEGELECGDDPEPGAELTYATECEAGVTFAWTNTGELDLRVKVYLNNADIGLLLTLTPGDSGGWSAPAGSIDAGDILKAEIFYGDKLIETTGNVVYAGECPDVSGSITYATECDAGVMFDWTNTGTVVLDVKLYKNDTLLDTTTVAAANDDDLNTDEGSWFLLQSISAGDTMKVELWYGDELIDSAEVTYAGDCPDVSNPDGEIAIRTKCDSNIDFDIINKGNVDLTYVTYLNGVASPVKDVPFNDVVMDALINPQAGDVFEIKVWYGDELIDSVKVVQPDPCPVVTTTTVPQTTTTTIPQTTTTVPVTTTTVPVPECLGPDDVDPRPQPGHGEPALPAIPQCDTPKFTG